MLHNSASGPEIGIAGRILAGLLPGKNRNRPSGRRSAGRRANFVLPAGVRPAVGPVSQRSMEFRGHAADSPTEAGESCQKS